jgi:hypothetical protein
MRIVARPLLLDGQTAGTLDPEGEPGRLDPSRKRSGVQMSKAIKTTLWAFCGVLLLVGVLLLLVPGRLLSALGWAPIDPLLTRLLGAALLGLAWGSFRSARAEERALVTPFLETFAAFTLLGCVGLLRHLLFARWPTIVWALFVVLAAFAAAWIVFLARRQES